jgi:tetratricopeptide (TPR) repeat protein
MPCRSYFLAIIFIFSSCASLFHRENDFERGLKLYRDHQYGEAAGHFQAFHERYPDHDSTLYYLFNCYKQLNRPEEQITVLETLSRRSLNDENIYLNLIYYYRTYERYRDLYSLLVGLSSPMQETVDEHLALTRRLFAELISGATKQGIKSDPLVYVTSKDYLPIFPDGQLRAEDTLNWSKLVVLLDRLMVPEYPKNFFPMKHISTKSYLYLPYMRLVDSDIIRFDPYIMPDAPAPVSTAVRAIEWFAKRGRFD